MSRLSACFFGLYAVALAASLIYWRPIIGLSVICLLAWLGWVVYREDGRKERDLARQGFHVELVYPSVLRDGPDDIAVVYYDHRGEIWFKGKLVGRKSVVSVPDSAAWERSVPEWASGQRQTVVERIQEAHRHIIIP